MIISEDFEQNCQTYAAEIQDRYINANYDIERKALPPNQIYLSPELLKEYMGNYKIIIHLGSENKSGQWNGNTQFNKQFPVDIRNDTPYFELLNHIKQTNNRILMVAETKGRRESLEGMFRANGIIPIAVEDFDEFISAPHEAPCLIVGELERGLTSNILELEIICESQLYGEKVYQRRRRSQESRDPESIIKSLAELNTGDPVVHIEHGIGRYMGLVTLDIADTRNEFLVIHYQNDDKLYVPVLSLNVISRFMEVLLSMLHYIGLAVINGKNRKRKPEKKLMMWQPNYSRSKR